MKPGYKRTEVGVIPEDWDITTVGAEFSIQLGKMLDAERNVGELKPYLGNRSVQWGRIDTDNLPLVRMSRADMQKYRLECGDLLVCEGGEVGRAAIWDRPMVECYYQKALHRLRPLKNYRARLLLEVLHQHSLNGFLTNFVTQTSIAHLPRDKFLLVPIPMLPEPEQDALVEVMHDVDTLVEELDLLISKKRGLKQAAMQQLLTGRTRLPGFHGEWEVKPYSHVFLRVNSKSCQLQASEYQRTGRFPVIDQSQHQVVAFTDLAERRMVCPPQGLVVFGDHTCVVKFVNFDFVVGADGTQLLQPRTGQNARFHAYQLQYRGIEPTGYNRHFRLLTERLFLVPSPDEQTAIASVLAEMDAEISALEARRDKTLALKQAMMQELLTGRTRLV